jgi:hypothetical protein
VFDIGLPGAADMELLAKGTFDLKNKKYVNCRDNW